MTKEPEQENAELKSKLTKATEIIKGLCDLIHWKHGYFHKEIIDAEKFLGQIHLCNTCSCKDCADRDFDKPVTTCKGYEKEIEK